jgi:hypothetical protein
MPVKRDEPGIGELSRRAQLASAECAGRTPALPQMGLDCVKSLGERQHSGKPRPLDCKTGLRCDPARILKRMLDKPVAAGLKPDDICHCPTPILRQLQTTVIACVRAARNLDRHQPAIGVADPSRRTLLLSRDLGAAGDPGHIIRYDRRNPPEELE